MKWFVKCIRNYVNFRGRARRAEYWYFTLFCFISMILAMILDMVLFGRPMVFYYCTALFLLLPSIAVSVRRLHDTGRSGKMLLWYYVTYFVWLFLSVVTGASFILSVMQGSLGASPSVAFLIVFFGGILALFVWAIFLIVWFCLPGDKGDNKYGSDPKTVEE